MTVTAAAPLPQTPAAPQASQFRWDINALRALAVAVVVLFHFGVPGFSGGFVGVDIFFVISGYLMTGIIVTALSKGTFSLWTFYLARMRRIVPALVAVGLLLLAVGWFMMGTLEYQTAAKHIVGSLAFFSNILYWRESGYFDAPSQDKWLLHTWSLSVEWQFYLLFPLFLLVVYRLRPHKSTLVLSLWLIAVGSFALSVIATTISPTSAFFLLPTRAWEFALGGIVLVHGANSWSSRRRVLIAIAGLGFIALSVAVFDGSVPYPGFRALLPALGTSLIIWGATDARWTRISVIQRLGDWSYSIYLWHWPLLVGLAYFAVAGSTVLKLVAITLSVVLGFISFSVVEQPTRRYVARQQYVQAIVFFVPAALVIFGACLVLAGRGVPARLSATALAAELEAENQHPRRDECLLTDSEAFSLPECVLGYTGDQPQARIALWGDSHSAAVMGALEQAALDAQARVTYYGFSSCPPLGAVERIENGKKTNCGLFNSSALARVVSNDYDAVFIAARWSVYLEGNNETADQDIPHVDFTDVEGGYGDLPLERQRSVYTSHIIDTLCGIQQMGVRAYVLGPIPEMGVNVPRRSVIIGAESVHIKLTDYKLRHKATLEAFEAASQQCGVTVLDPVPFLCDSVYCYGGKDGRPLYFDDDHLSEFGNRLLAPLFDDAIPSLNHGTTIAQ